MRKEDYQKRLNEISQKVEYGTLSLKGDEVSYRQMRSFKGQLPCEISLLGKKDHFFSANVTMGGLDRFCLKIQREHKSPPQSFTHLFREKEEEKITNFLHYFKVKQLLEMRYQIGTESYIFCVRVMKVKMDHHNCDLEVHVCSMPFPQPQIDAWINFYQKETEGQQIFEVL